MTSSWMLPVDANLCQQLTVCLALSDHKASESPHDPGEEEETEETFVSSRLDAELSVPGGEES